MLIFIYVIKSFDRIQYLWYNVKNMHGSGFYGVC